MVRRRPALVLMTALSATLALATVPVELPLREIYREVLA